MSLESATASASVLSNYSLEMTAKDRPALDAAADLIAPGTQIAVTFLPNEEMDERIEAAKHIRALGFEPMPHLSARRITSRDELVSMIERLTAEAQINRAFLVAGDPPDPAGPFEDALSMLETGVFEANGIEIIGIAGHPEGHPVMDSKRLWHFMGRKLEAIHHRGMSPLIVTQFGFDPDAFGKWLSEVRECNITAPVRLGVPGPAGIKRLLRYAAFCGVGASVSVLKKYGISLGNLMGNAGPDKLVEALSAPIRNDTHGTSLHFYPFGGLEPTVKWISSYKARSEN